MTTDERRWRRDERRKSKDGMQVNSMERHTTRFEAETRVAYLTRFSLSIKLCFMCMRMRCSCPSCCPVYSVYSVYSMYSSWLSSCICVCVSCAWLLEMRSLFSLMLLLCDSLPVFFFMASFVFGFFSRREGNRRRDMQYLLSLIPLDGYRLRPSFSSNNTSSAISLQYFNSLYRTRECFMCLVMQVKRRKEEREPFFSKFVREGNSILLVLLFLFLLMSLLRYASVARLKNALLW